MKRFLPAVGDGFRRTFDYRGRTTRADFWWFYLGLTVISILINMVIYVFDSNVSALSVFLGGLTGPQVIVSVLLLIPTMSAIVRRLRDANFSPAHMLWYLIPNLFAYVMYVLGYLVPGHPVSLFTLLLLSLFMIIIYVIGYVVLLVLLTYPSRNKYTVRAP